MFSKLSIAALAEFGAETRFRVRESRGNPEAGLHLLHWPQGWVMLKKVRVQSPFAPSQRQPEVLQ